MNIAALAHKFTCNLKDKNNWLSFLAGASLVFAYAPFSQWWITPIVLTLWLSRLAEKTAPEAAKQGFIFSLAWLLSGISWVHVAIDQFGGMPLAISLLLMLLLCLYLSIYPTLACYFSARLTKNKTVCLWLIPAFWLIFEYLRGVVLTGFPWLSLGYSQIDGPLAALAPFIGEVGITFTLWVIAICLHNVLFNNHRALHAAICIPLVVVITVFNNLSAIQLQNKTVSVALIQGNVKQEMKWQPELEWPTMQKYLDLTRTNYPADLIIWPESAITALEPMNNAQDFLSIADSSAAFNQSSIITGIINYNMESRAYYNSLIVLGKKHKEDTSGSYRYNHNNRYYKNHLLPIGEFIPFQAILRPLAPLFNLPMSSFSRGDYVQQNLVAQDLHILPLICFEIAFPEQLAANFTDKTNILLTVSNDSWFGNSHGPHQHLEIARMRALEFGRPLLRATNNGVTAVIDHNGSIQSVLPQFEEAVLTSDVQLVKGNTFYSIWWRFIHWLLPLINIALCLFFINKKQAQPKSS